MSNVTAPDRSRPWTPAATQSTSADTVTTWPGDPSLVHRPDLPILPGNAGNLPLLGLGLWRSPLAALLVELALVAVGAYLYWRAAQRAPTRPAGTSPPPVPPR